MTKPLEETFEYRTMTDPTVRAFIGKYEVSEDAVHNGIFKLAKMTQENRNCLACRGSRQCCNDFTDYFMTCEMVNMKVMGGEDNPQIMERLKPCRFRTIHAKGTHSNENHKNQENQ